MPARYLVDTSALARSERSGVKERLRPLFESGQAAICGVIALEMLYSTRSLADMSARRVDLARTFVRVAMTEADLERAEALMQDLASQGMHRAAGPADLLVAACAERTDVTILHYDADFDLIASITGQRAEWVVPRGSVP
jgi:predicted nucleic acid-binding protein